MLARTGEVIAVTNSNFTNEVWKGLAGQRPRGGRPRRGGKAGRPWARLVALFRRRG